MKNSHILLAVGVLAALAGSCSTQRKLASIQRGETAAALSMGIDTSLYPELRNRPVTRDTLKIKDDDGTQLLVMRAFRDEATGEIVPTEELSPAVVTARFRNIAERHGKVDLAFQVIVPGSMQDSRWQLRFYPDMYFLGDSVRLDPVMITGNSYRKSQLRGYQQYNRFLSRIVSDTTRFVNIRQLEIFLKRNIPQLYAFKTDSSYVSDEQFYTMYGVSEREAVEHYTNKIARRRNERRAARLDKMYSKYIKVPIVTEGIRLDTVMVSPFGDFIYNYVQTINTRPRLRKVDVTLSGDIYEADKRLYQIPRSEPLTFYISSVSAFTDGTERYMTKVVERRASANTVCHVDFEQGRSEVKLDLGTNAQELGRIRKTLAYLLQDQVYDMDSIIVTSSASPEGKISVNQRLSKARSESVSRYLHSCIRTLQDSLAADAGLQLDAQGQMRHFRRVDIPFISRTKGENWDMLTRLVDQDPVLTDGNKSDYDLLARVKDLDQREHLLSQERFYPYLRDRLYPRLRTVGFEFYLHRRDMVKDTVHTTVLDSVYMQGVRALQNMDYEGALERLEPYQDFNTAVAYMGLDRNHSAMEILSREKSSAPVNYLLAILYSRMGDDQKAVEKYLLSCKQNPSYVHRGNLDPEISVLIKLYGLHKNGDLSPGGN